MQGRSKTSIKTYRPRAFMESELIFVTPDLSDLNDFDLQTVLGSSIVVDPVSCNVYRGFYSVDFRFVVQQKLSMVAL